MRWLVMAMVAGALCAEAEPAPTGTYAFPRDQPLWYRYSLMQDTSWESAGDQLRYVSAVRWTFALRAVEVTTESAQLKATIVRVEASLTGPGTETRVDSREPADGEPDPVFGHLVALAGVTFDLQLHQLTGRITAASGGHEVVQRLERKYPGAAPGEPGPVAVAAQTLYSDAALAAWWTQLFALPAAGPLAAPNQTFVLPRTWEGLTWTASQPAGDPPRLTLAGEPLAVSAALGDLTGSGTVAIADGVPAASGGELSFTLDLEALSQGVRQQHHLRWTLERLETGE